MRTRGRLIPWAFSFAVMHCSILRTAPWLTLLSGPNRCGYADSNKALIPRSQRPPLSYQVQQPQRLHRFSAFTLLELLIVIGIVAVVVAISFPIVSQLRTRAQRVQCSGNLRSLYIATELFLQQNESWP